jgi:2,3-bisphosphoglycerate-independent phosphoglycerate mutase
MKYLILVGDGMGDFPVPELDGRTPLEAANIPTIDDLCQKGEFFLNNTVPDGFPPGSDVANMSLMGYAPASYYTGRAPIEAAAMGIHLEPDEIAFRCNMVTLDFNNDEVTMRDFCAGHITNEESHELIKALQAECGTDQFQFKPGVSYRHLLIFKGEHPGFTTVPPHDYIEQHVTSHFQEYQQQPAWKELLEKARTVLADHPVNKKRIEAGKNPASLVWLWGEGKMPAVPSLTDKFNISGSMISAVDLLKGLGVLGGLDPLDIPGATGYIDTNYKGKADAAIDALKKQDFVFVHLEGPEMHREFRVSDLAVGHPYRDRIGVSFIIQAHRCFFRYDRHPMSFGFAITNSIAWCKDDVEKLIARFQHLSIKCPCALRA